MQYREARRSRRLRQYPSNVHRPTSRIREQTQVQLAQGKLCSRRERGINQHPAGIQVFMHLIRQSLFP